jgi:hypothetical protein
MLRNCEKLQNESGHLSSLLLNQNETGTFILSLLVKLYPCYIFNYIELSAEEICFDHVLQASTIDGRRKGACLFCQEYFMDLYLLAELKTISLKVTTVDMQKPPPDFRLVTNKVFHAKVVQFCQV